MIENDTVKLLRECDAGIKMGVAAIDNVIENVRNDNFSGLLRDSRKEHEKLLGEVGTLLCRYHGSNKEPSPVAKGMSQVKTSMRMMMNDSDNTVADLITDGCNMGVKSLHRYLNMYRAANEKSRDIAKRLINIEERLTLDIRAYL